MGAKEANSDIVVRVARVGDLDGLYALSVAAGAGMTSLPADREALAKKLEQSSQAATSASARAAGHGIWLIAENRGAGADVVASACIVPRIGVTWPFYSYRITRDTRTSQRIAKRVSHDILNLANDFDGEVEVGGLFVRPDMRGRAAGRLIARARYLFLAQHRDWFGRRVIAELRGYQDLLGASPFWEAVGRRFFDMSFAEADRLNALTGNQFIADLGPKHPIYLSLLAEPAQNALGRPHDDGRPAMELLVEEGFRFEAYVDIFDGGPTLVAEIDALAAVKDSRASTVVSMHELIASPDRLVSAGSGVDFRVARGEVKSVQAGGLSLEERLAEVLGVAVGESVRHVAF